MKTNNVLLSIVSVVILTACAKQDPQPIDTSSDSPELKAAQEYFDSTLVDIVQAKCVSCHSGFSSFQGAANSSGSMYTQVKRGSMPPSGSLSKDDKGKFSDFYDKVMMIP